MRMSYFIICASKGEKHGNEWLEIMLIPCEQEGIKAPERGEWTLVNVDPKWHLPLVSVTTETKAACFLLRLEAKVLLPLQS